MSQDRSSSVGIFGGSFDPPGLHHVELARKLTEFLPEVTIIPCGPRPDRSFYVNDPKIRAELAKAAFSEIKKVSLDLTDIFLPHFTYTADLDERLRQYCNPVHVIGADIVKGGRENSQLVRSWHRGAEIWDRLEFLVITRPGIELSASELPPRATLKALSINGSSTEIRERLKRKDSVSSLVPQGVEQVLKREGFC